MSWVTRAGFAAFVGFRGAQGTAQPGWIAHSTELSVEHLAAVPAHAVQVQPAPVHAMLVSFTSQASGVPVQAEPDHLQPETFTHVSVVTRLPQDAASPLHEGVQVQPEFSHSVEVASTGHAVGVPLHEVVNTQPAILPQAARSAAELQVLGEPLQLSVATQPFALPHC